MPGDGEGPKEALRPGFNHSIMIDFRGAKFSSGTDFLLLREMDERFGVIGPMDDCLEDRRSPVHTRHSLVQMICQRVHPIGAGYEDCNDADHLRIGPALRLAIGKGLKVKVADFHYQAKSRTRPRRVVCKLEWPQGEMSSGFPGRR